MPNITEGQYAAAKARYDQLPKDRVYGAVGIVKTETHSFDNTKIVVTERSGGQYITEPGLLETRTEASILQQHFERYAGGVAISGMTVLEMLEAEVAEDERRAKQAAMAGDAAEQAAA